MVPDQTQLRSKTFLIRPNCARTVYDQTQLRSNALLIRPNCARTLYDQIQLRSNSLWSDPSALEEVMIRLSRPKWPLIRPSPDHDQTVVRSKFGKDPVISVWEHTGVRSTGSDQKSIWVWTSTWAPVFDRKAEVLFPFGGASICWYRMCKNIVRKKCARIAFRSGCNVFEMSSDQNIMRSNPRMISLFYTWGASNQTIQGQYADFCKLDDYSRSSNLSALCIVVRSRMVSSQDYSVWTPRTGSWRGIKLNLTFNWNWFHISLFDFLFLPR